MFALKENNSTLAYYILPDRDLSHQHPNLNSGGILHVHGNCLSVEREKWGKQVEQDIFNIIQEKGGAIQESFQSVQCIHVERVKSYAPRVDHVVADIEIRCRQ